jgi:hypothetical protein
VRSKKNLRMSQPVSRSGTRMSSSSTRTAKLVRRRCCSCSPSPKALHDVPRDTSITVTALMLRVSGTNFFHRAKMDDTPAGRMPKAILRMWRRAASMP